MISLHLFRALLVHVQRKKEGKEKESYFEGVKKSRLGNSPTSLFGYV